MQVLLHELSESCHTRYPVIGEPLDDVKGIIAFKDVAQALAVPMINLEASFQPWITKPQFIPESLALGDVLEVMKKTGSSDVNCGR